MIRFGTSKDIEIVNVMRKQVNELHVKGEPKIFKPGFSEALKNYINEFVDSDNKKLVVYEENDSVLGYAMIEFLIKPETAYRYELKFLEVNELGVMDGYQHKGIGKKIMDYIIELAKKNKVNRVELDVWTFNDNACKFYNKYGFTSYRNYLKLEL